jgi:hypothetical protein
MSLFEGVLLSGARVLLLAGGDMRCLATFMRRRHCQANKSVVELITPRSSDASATAAVAAI